MNKKERKTTWTVFEKTVVIVGTVDTKIKPDFLAISYIATNDF